MARNIEFNREEVLERCMYVFWEKGFDKTSISDLEEHSGLVRTSLYNSFGSKDDLFKEVIEYFIRTKCVYWTDILLGEPTVIGGVEKLLDVMISENFDQNFPTGCLITYSAAGISNQSEKIQNRIVVGHEVMLGGIKQALNNGKEAGEFGPALDVEATSLFVLNTFQGVMVLSKTVGTKDNMHSIKEMLLSYLKTLRMPA